jgi:hypothetical protein
MKSSSKLFSLLLALIVTALFVHTKAQPYSIIKNETTTILPGHHEGVPSTRRILILQFNEDVMVKKSSFYPSEKGSIEIKKGATLEVIGSCSESDQENYSEVFKELIQEELVRIISGCAALDMLTIEVSNGNHWVEYLIPEAEKKTIAAP